MYSTLQYYIPAKIQSSAYVAGSGMESNLVGRGRPARQDNERSEGCTWR